MRLVLWWLGQRDTHTHTNTRAQRQRDACWMFWLWCGTCSALDNKGLLLCSSLNIKALLATAAANESLPIVAPVLHHAVVKFLNADVVPYPIVRDLWLHLSPGYGVPFHQVLKGSSFVLQSPKPQERVIKLILLLPFPLAWFFSAKAQQGGACVHCKSKRGLCRFFCFCNLLCAVFCCFPSHMYPYAPKYNFSLWRLVCWLFFELSLVWFKITEQGAAGAFNQAARNCGPKGV